MERTRDNAELSDAFTEVLWTPLEHIGPTRMRQENKPGPYPLASTLILEYPSLKEWWEYQLVSSILGDHLGLLFCSG